MTVTKGPYYKALILLTVFGLNTVVSFACSLSSLFHDFHHHNSSAKIDHHAKSSHNHSHDGAHQHTHGNTHSHEHDKAPTENKDAGRNQSKDDCCSNSIVEMQQVDKSISRTIHIPSIVFVTTFLAAYYQLSAYCIEQPAFLPDDSRWRPPATIQDIRVVIQSFQI